MKIAILGGGISGLSAAWQLVKKYPKAHITVFEKEERLGGCIASIPYEGWWFEQGPQVFSPSKSPSLLSLIEEVGLKEEILFTKATTRYLLHCGKLRPLGSMVFRFLPTLLREPFLPRTCAEDESIYDFAARRFSPRVAELIFDPMTSGIYGGDIRKLSLKSCYPTLFAWEREKGSILKGFFTRKKTQGPKGLFTLQRGMISLVRALEERLPIEIIRGVAIDQIEKGTVSAGQRLWEADLVISALPQPTLAQLTRTSVDTPSISLWVISCAFPDGAFAKRGLGHLVPTMEKEAVLGAIWHSRSLFTVMVRNGGDATWATQTAAVHLRRYLHIQEEPLFTHAHLALQAIPQLTVGYEQRLKLWLYALQEKYPFLSVIGNYLQGPSVENCIRNSKSLYN